MFITTKVTTEQQIEVTLPYYAKDNICHWYKVISENRMIMIFKGKDRYVSVDLTEYCINSAFDDTSTEITQKEFNDKFNEVNKIIMNHI